MTSFELDGRVAVVSGSARGIGEAIVRTLAKNGASILLVDILEDGVKKVAADLTKEYPNAKFYAIGVDLTKQSEINRIGDFYKQHFKQSPDIVVNNAAICKMTNWSEISEEEYDLTLASNLKSVHMIRLKEEGQIFEFLKQISLREYLGQYFARMAVEQKRKQSIINISSFTTYAGHLQLGHYVAAKSGVIGLMKVMAKELGPKGIRVNCVCPGYIRTPMNAHISDEEFEKITTDIPIGRTGRPQDIANMVLFLASDLASFCHGSCYDVHGGHTM